jgi:hypothetical protein
MLGKMPHMDGVLSRCKHQLGVRFPPRPSFDIGLHLRDSAALPGNLLALTVDRLVVG